VDWSLAIDINREALKRVVAALVAMAGFADAFTSRPTLPRHLHRAVLRLLRPAESAARRLIVVAARDVVAVASPPRSRKAKANPSLFVKNGAGTGIVLPPGITIAGIPEANHARSARSGSFALFDPMRPPFPHRRPKSSGVPRIWAPGCVVPTAIPVRKPTMPGDPIDARRLGQRLTALGRVLDDLPRAARRFAHWRARAMKARSAGNPTTSRRRLWPFKPGLPPGARRPGSRRPVHAVDEILSATHGLALWVLAHPDTS
jgi:hypothetical protein